MHKYFFLLLFFILTASILSQEEARLLRFPAIYEEQIVFSCAGDLYTVASSGGTARKLTNDIGYEMFARFSPDGENIAFTAQYDGNTEVYVMPSQGGIPKRLTYTATLNRDDISDRMGPNNIVMGWKDDEYIIYRSRGREWNSFKGQLYLVSKNGGPSEQLPLPRGGFCSYSPDQTKLAYNRIFREFRTWKRYHGGQCDDISIYDFITKTTTNITNHPSQDIIPMWYQNKIYFLSDRDQRMNIFCYDCDTRNTHKITNFTDFDVKFPSLGDTAIVFENGGYIYLLDLDTEETEKISIQLNDDADVARDSIIDVSKYLEDIDISPDGKRAAIVARGELFTAPVKNGVVRNLSNTSGAHERSVAWSPDGKWLACISDASGEDEIYIIPQAGGKPTQLTTQSDTYKYRLQWSPDSKKILWNDKLQRLQFIDIATQKTTLVNQATAWEITTFNWSPDNKWIVYERTEDMQLMTLYLYSLEQNKSFPITDGWSNSYNGVFSDDGKYLFFISMKTFNPTYGSTEWNHIYQDMEKIYFVTLNLDVKSPFAPKSDEVTIKADPPKETKPEDKTEPKPEDKDKEKSITIVLEGITNRILDIPVHAGQHGQLSVVENKLYYTRASAQDEEFGLFMYDLDKLTETSLGACQQFVISADRKKMLVLLNGQAYIIDLPMGRLDLKDKLPLSDLKMKLNRQEEWHQIFNETWRQMRDFFYAPNMHGVDWRKIRDTYAQLVPHVRHRADLTYILGEMIGEINAGHCYVGNGDYPKPERIKTGLLGAKLQRDSATGFYRIDKILAGQNWDKSLRSPLLDIGVKAQEGDYILAINDQDVSKLPDIYAGLVGLAGKQVKLTLNKKANLEDSWETVVIPTDDEQNLYYFNWVQNNVNKVTQATQGKVGYIHVPDMGVNGLNQFAKYFYPQIRKQGLIIDVRGNGGGNVSPMLIERLRRELVMIDIARNTSVSYNPGEMHYGPKVCLMDEFSASDGDIFPYRFRYYKLGKLIGKRSWGGVVGIRGSLPFVDGGYLNKPEFSRYDIEGKEWIMEGHGVDPDILVDNDPAHEFLGHDAQLLRAIDEVMRELQFSTKTLPPPPPYPDKSK